MWHEVFKYLFLVDKVKVFFGKLKEEYVGRMYFQQIKGRLSHLCLLKKGKKEYSLAQLPPT